MRRILLLALGGLAGVILAGCQGTTEGPTSVTATSARLNARGTAKRGPVYTYFQYGRTTRYGSRTPTRTWPAGVSGPFSETVRGLLPSTTYHYRMCGNETGKYPICAQDVYFTTPVRNDLVIAAAGDIACSPRDPNYKGGAGTSSACRQRATSNLLVGKGYSAVLPLGDNQYDCSASSDFTFSFNPSWGRVKSLLRPVPGNHEYKSSNPDRYGGNVCRSRAQGYFGYFGSAAGDPSKGYYSYNLGAWHIVALNSGLAGSSCGSVVACGLSSPQERWLRADLAANRRRCTLAYWHAPLFASSKGRSSAMKTLWADLQAAGADVVLNGHVHGYERFAPQTSNGVARSSGIREFIVGTGGKSLESLAAVARNSQKRGRTFGVLELTLRDSGYGWRFVPEAGKSFTDSGGAFCS
jgi:hypothetical protein